MTEPPDEPDDWDDEWDAPHRRRGLFGLDTRTAWTVVVAGGAAVAVAAVVIALIVIGNGGGNSSGNGGSGSTPTATDVGTAAPGAGVTCAVLSRDPSMTNRITFTDGGVAPTGLPLPGAAPAHVCNGTPVQGPKTDVTALIWPDVSLASYERQLSDAGWVAAPAGPVVVYTEVGSPYQIALLSVTGALVALYHQ